MEKVKREGEDAESWEGGGHLSGINIGDRRRNWTWMILVGSFQLGAFYDPVILRTC